MDNNKNENNALEKVRELMTKHQEKMDSATVVAPDVKCRSEGYLEALYHVENLLINF